LFRGRALIRKDIEEPADIAGQQRPQKFGGGALCFGPRKTITEQAKGIAFRDPFVNARQGQVAQMRGQPAERALAWARQLPGLRQDQDVGEGPLGAGQLGIIRDKISRRSERGEARF
jgi:hypothetical protein